MRPIHSFALTLLLATSFSAPAYAAEPDAPGALITRPEAIRMAVQNRLSEKFSATTEQKKDEKGAWWSITPSPTKNFSGWTPTA
ncbi:hypothetical protein AUC69_13825 [Methyloceanibacter superfactus]|uniref:Uncharacterized protein n=1 Tax=Methyloceanibacter superfactus TaxID=1774969 RepID=A0A1E3VT13_9HYPH|nr:hypothetical protein [Methyloceanibacter superfactus]ODR96680.1 hypothetical protein AUC69_13825 [Methyloceanibacter superfactus]